MRSLPRRTFLGVAEHIAFTAGIFPKRVQIKVGKFDSASAAPRRAARGVRESEYGKEKRNEDDPRRGEAAPQKKCARVRRAGTKIPPF